ncbi:MAG: serine/threonine kinase PAK-like protein [Amphiamblys sp. WSBS2006]|nr:MAG: serine/threonine kinase PAK-like protein [Amphiamblys sp. WSBS2006]
MGGVETKKGEVLKEGAGYLPPSGLGVLFSRWRPVWVVIEQDALVFYTDKSKCKKKHQTALKDVQTCRRKGGQSKQYVLCMDLAHQQEQMVGFDTEQELDGWTEAIGRKAPRMVAAVPRLFKHEQHLGVSEGEITGLPPRWKALLENSDITKNEYERNREAVEQAVAFYTETVQLEALEEQQRAEEGEAEYRMILEEIAAESSPWGRYREIEVLYQTAAWCVYEVADSETDEVFMMKQIKIGEDVERVEIVKELKVLLQTKHPNIANVVEACFYDEDVFVVFENIRRRTLERISEKVEMQDREITAICRSVLEGLVFLHANGILHRNICTASIGFSGSFVLKLTNFGHCLNLCDRRKVSYWTAPEVIRKDGIDGRADVWSVGILALELLDGKPPYSGKDPIKVFYKIATEDPPRPDVEGETGVAELIRRCLVKRQDRRPDPATLLHGGLFEDCGQLGDIAAQVRDAEDKV